MKSDLQLMCVASFVHHGAPPTQLFLWYYCMDHFMHVVVVCLSVLLLLLLLLLLLQTMFKLGKIPQRYSTMVFF